MTPVKCTVLPVRANFDTFACFFSLKLTKSVPVFWYVLSKLRQNLLEYKQNRKKILLRFSDPSGKRTVWVLQTVFGNFVILRYVRGVKTLLSSVSIKKFASHEICP